MARLGRIAIVFMMAGGLVVAGMGPAFARPAEPPDDDERPHTTAPQDDESAATTAAVREEARGPKTPGDDVAYGLALRGRYVSVPGWLLGFFTKHNVPL